MPGIFPELLFKVRLIIKTHFRLNESIHSAYDLIGDRSVQAEARPRARDMKFFAREFGECVVQDVLPILLADLMYLIA